MFGVGGEWGGPGPGKDPGVPGLGFVWLIWIIMDPPGWVLSHGLGRGRIPGFGVGKEDPRCFRGS